MRYQAREYAVPGTETIGFRLLDTRFGVWVGPTYMDGTFAQHDAEMYSIMWG